MTDFVDPQDSHVASLVGNLADEYLERCRQGETPDIEEYAKRYPRFAGVIRQMLTAIQVLGKKEAPLGSDTSDLGIGKTTYPARPRNPVLPDAESPPGYELLEEVGRGGMGVVYKARQLALDRVVALKMIRSGELADDDALQRFRTEAVAVAQLQHPHVVQIFEVAEHNGTPFFSFEFLEGGSLADRLRGEPQPPRQAAEQVKVLAQAMNAVHERGLVHRDLKPANILLAADGTLKITDFGLVKRIKEPALTQTGVIVGTPSYLAPELAEAHNTRIKPAADVWSLGAILYEMLTGRPPFRGITALETLLQVRTQEPVSIRRMQPGCPKDLETICLKCLHKEPHKRYSSMTQFAEDLDRFLHDRPILARPVGSLERLGRWVRRKPVLAAAAAVIALLAVTLLAGAAVYNIRLSDALEQQTSYSRQLQETNKKLTDKNRQIQMQLALRDEDRGRLECNRDNVALGLHYLARSLESAPKDATGFRQTVLANLSAWRHQLHPLADTISHQGPVRVCMFSPNGETFFTGGNDKTGRIWNTATRQPIGNPLLHGEKIVCAAFSPDGTRIMTGSMDNTAVIWDAATGVQIGLPLKHKANVLCVAFAADGKLVLTGSEDRTAHFWNAETGYPVGKPLQHQKIVRCVAFSPDGKLAMTAGDDGNGQIWNVKTQKPHGPPLQHGGPIFGAAFSPDGARVLTGSWDNTARLWDVANAKQIGDPLNHTKFVWRVAYGPLGKTVATADIVGVAQIWDAATGKPISKPLKHKTTIWCLAYSPDGKKILTGSEDGTAQLWEVATGRPLGQSLKHNGGIPSVAIAPNGKLALTGGLDNATKLWKIGARGLAGPVLEHGGDVISIAFSADGNRIATGSSDGTAAIWEAASGKKLHLLPHGKIVWDVKFSSNSKMLLSAANLDAGARLWNTSTGKRIGPKYSHDRSVRCVAFHPDNRMFATGGFDQAVKIWHVKGNAPVVPSRKFAGKVRCLAFSPDGKFLAVGCLVPEHLCWLWDVETGQWHKLPFHHRIGVSSFAFSQNGTSLLVAGSAGKMCYWDVATQKRLLPPMQCQTSITSIDLNPDGKLATVGTGKGIVQIWDLATGKLRHSRPRHPRYVARAVFSPNGSRMLSGSFAGDAQLWDVITGTPIGPPMLHQKIIRGAAFSPDGKKMLTCGDDGTARLWNAPAEFPDSPKQILNWLQVITGMELTANDEVILFNAENWQSRKNSYLELYPQTLRNNHPLALEGAHQQSAGRNSDTNPMR